MKIIVCDKVLNLVYLEFEFIMFFLIILVIIFLGLFSGIVRDFKVEI